jgi:DNA polymerase-3 subunit alpha
VTQVNLHCHSEHSFLDGFASVSSIARRVREVGSDAVALTDHNEVNGHLAFQKACRSEGVHPILGIEADWVTDIGWTRENLKYPSNRSHICLLAADNTGLSNLWALASMAYTDKYRYHKPLLDPDLMRQYSKGLYASDGCMITQFSRYIEAGDDTGARNQLGILADIYRDNLYVELHTWQFIDADTDEKRRLNDLMGQINRAKVRFATEMGLPMVVVNDSHHAYPDDWDKKELVWDFNTRKNPDQSSEDYGQKADHLMGGDELHQWMSRHGISADIVDEAITNAAAIAARCTAEITPTLTMPRLTKTDADDVAMLIDFCEQGFAAKVVNAGVDHPEQYYERLEEELRLVIDKRFSGYFLTVRDYVHAAKTGSWSQYVSGGQKHPMLVGPGRGSAGGSLVAYLLGITTIDPIHYKLLFSRFLSASRKGYPDIDCDFPQSLRPGIKDYLAARYGADHVCAIGTLTRSQPKAILKDLGRAMKIPIADVIAMGKIIEGVSAIQADDGTDDDASWAEIVERKGGALAEWARKYPILFERINDMAGIVRQAGVHPSGVVVSNLPILGALPTRVKNATTATQLDMNECEELGAVKLDLLGLRHLDTLMVARDMVWDRHGFWLDYVGVDDHNESGTINFGPDQYADPDIWGQIDAGQTAGIFQLETPELTRLSMEMKPRNEVDVAALLSIVRPGVKDAHLDKAYLRRRHGLDPVVYDHPAMQPITEETYGILVYQEQMMQAARDLAGFSADDADDLRKMLGKKNAAAITAWEGKFVAGCLGNPAFRDHFASEPQARTAISHIWSSISAAGRYAFNKSHAVGYATISCWEIWTKHYYPQEYIVALMATDSDNINRYLREARKRGIAVLPPDINTSGRKFTLGDNAIRYGLDTIRGVGNSAVSEILARRPFASFDDFLSRVRTNACGKTQIEALIKIGAFDAFGDRTALMTAYHDRRILDKMAPGKLAKMDADEQVIHVATWRAKHAGEESYVKEFAVPDFADDDVVYTIEQELVGNYVTIDPMMRYLDALEATGAVRSPAEMEEIQTGDDFVIGGQLTKIRTHTIQKAGRYKGKTMAFLTVFWNEEEFEVTAFPEVWLGVKTVLKEGKPVACHVVRDDRGAHLRTVERLDLLFDEMRSR